MIHVNDILNRLPTLTKHRSRTCHLKIINVNHTQQIKLSVVKDALPDLRRNSSPAYRLKLIFTTLFPNSAGIGMTVP